MISACIICRDEETNLPRCLDSLTGAVDELVVVDTGSSDASMSIANDRGAKVIQFTWRDDFAAARNESLKHATGDFILWLDADQELVETEPGALRQLCRDLPDTELGLLLAVHSVMDTHGAELIAWCWQLFRNHRGISFTGRIHEQVVPPEGAPLLLPERRDAAYLRHWGYLAAHDRARKSERNLRLLQSVVADEPEDPCAYMNLGRQLLVDGHPETAWTCLLEGIDRWRRKGRPASPPYVPVLFLAAAVAGVQGSFWQPILGLAAEAPAECHTAEFLGCIGAACWQLGYPDQAIACFTRARNDISLPQALEMDPSARTWKPLLALAQMYHHLGRGAEASVALSEAVALAPDNPQVLSVAGMLAAAP